MSNEAGAKAADLSRKHGVCEATIYSWKAKYGGMDVSDAKRLKALEEENVWLKKLLAEQMLARRGWFSASGNVPKSGHLKFADDLRLASGRMAPLAWEYRAAMAL